MSQPKYVPIRFEPDADPSWLVNPGVLTEVRNLVPSTRGTLMNYTCTAGENVPRVSAFVHGALPVSAAILELSSIFATQRARFVIGTGTDLLEVANTSTATISNVSRSAGVYSSYYGWSFCTYGNTIIATPVAQYQPAELPQVSSTVGGAFANQASATIKGSLCLVQKGFLLLFNVYDGTTWNGDGWACSGLNNLSSWVTDLSSAANLSTQANYGRLLDAPGTIRAAENMRDRVVVYKDDSIFVGSYTGNPYTWSFQLVTDEVGCSACDGVAVVNGMHYFIHRTGLYVFDGSFPRNIGLGKINEFIGKKLSLYQPNVKARFKAVVVQEKNLILWYFSGNEYAQNTYSETADCAIAYNYVTGQFGFIDRPWEDQSSSGSIGMGCPVALTMDAHDEYTSYVLPKHDLLTVGVNSGSIYIRAPLIGQGATSSDTTCGLATGAIGDDIKYQKLRRVKPKLKRGDDNLQSAVCRVDTKSSEGDYFTGEGILLTATATSTAAGYARSLILSAVTGFPHRRTVLAGDYMAFDVCQFAGSLSTPVGIYVTFSDTSTAHLTTTITALNAVTSALVDMTAYVGKTIVNYWVQFGTAGATGSHVAAFRKVRITDSTGALRERVYDSSEARIFVNAAQTSNYSNASSRVTTGYGQAYSYDTTRRRFDGTLASRFFRVDLTLYNQNEIGGLWLDMADAGSE